MESFLIKERYKVIHVEHAEEDYAALEAVDIQSREKSDVLLNVYEGRYLKEYLRYYDRLRFCPEYRGMFVAEESLVAMFDHRDGPEIDQVFCKGAQLNWDYRLETAGQLFHQALSMADYPPEIACMAFLSKNIRILPNDRKIAINFAVRPMEELCEREMIFLLTDQIKKVLIKRWASPKPERAFVREIGDGSYKSIVALYSRWIEAEKEIRAAYEMIDAKTAVGRALYLLFMNLSCLFGGKKKKKVS